MKFVCLASSSAGNAYYIELEREGLAPIKLLIEAGLAYKELVSKLSQNGLRITEIDVCLVTHAHMDHCKAVGTLKDRYLPIYANERICSLGNELSHSKSRFVATDTKVLPFEVMHDSPSLGFVISTGKETILFVNDCKYFETDLSAFTFDYVCIEANYDGQVLHFAYEEAKKMNDFGNIARYERLFDSHMSISNCIKHLKKLNLTKCKAIFLMHLSDRHANSSLFKMRVKEETGVNTFVCKKYGGIL